MSRPPQPPKPPHGMTEKAARKFVDATVARYGAGSALARAPHDLRISQGPPAEMAHPRHRIVGSG